MIWTLVRGPSDVEDGINPQPLKSEPRKVKDIPDFDYKYDNDKNVEYSDQGSRGDLNVKHSVHNYIQSHQDQIKAVNANIKDNLLISNNLEDEVPSEDLSKSIDSVRLKEKPTRSHRNSLNGVNIQIDDSVDWAAIGGADLFKSQPVSGVHSEFASDEAKIVPGLGEMGEPVVLSGHEASLGENIMKTEAFNLIVSDKISYTRELPDTRDSRCKAVYYDKDLPSTSVIIIFTNEAWSPLIRTIWSVLNRSPPHLVHEIILVDDYSDKAHLKGKLERYIRRYFPSKVKLMRLPKREGLIRARLAGARAATGEVILYLDSHCECNQGWLEPLLARIHENPMAFVVPIIDVIDDKTLEYYHGNGNYFQIGGFTWSGHFTWIDIPDHEKDRTGHDPVAAIRSPTMAGGLFAVDRRYFWEVGSYDEEMDVWGGENLEMSFRVWQCGGVIETLPCSRVGHIFRSFHPYSFPNNKDTHGINTARTVEVWMDDYKRLFYMNRPDLVNTDVGDMKARMEFKEQKQCKPFKWFLQNIYPQKFILDSPEHVFAYGRLRNEPSGLCLDTLQHDDKDTYNVGIYACHQYVTSSQFFSFSRDFQLRREDSCAILAGSAENGGMGSGIEPEIVKMVPCVKNEENQQWIHTKQGRLIHKLTNKCLDAGEGENMDDLRAGRCKASTGSQIWFFDVYHDV